MSSFQVRIYWILSLYCDALAECSDDDGAIIIAVKAVAHAAVNIKLLENAFQKRVTIE